MTSPLSRISTGSFFSGVMREYSSLGWPGTTVAGMNSILSIRPSSIAAMRTLRAKGEAGEKESFIGVFLECSNQYNRHPEVRALLGAPRRMGRSTAASVILGSPARGAVQ